MPYSYYLQAFQKDVLSLAGSWEWQRREMVEKIESHSQEVTGATHHPALYLGLRLRTQDFRIRTWDSGLSIKIGIDCNYSQELSEQTPKYKCVLQRGTLLSRFVES